MAPPKIDTDTYQGVHRTDLLLYDRAGEEDKVYDIDDIKSVGTNPAQLIAGFTFQVPRQCHAQPSTYA